MDLTWTLLIWLAQAVFDLFVWVLLAWLVVTRSSRGRHDHATGDRSPPRDGHTRIVAGQEGRGAGS
jgi:hypothetical protein